MITSNDVKYIAHLSRIHLKDTEVETLRNDLDPILGYVEKLNKIDVSNVAPMAHIMPLKNVFRKDCVKQSLSQSESTSISRSNHNGMFKVPPIIE